MAANIHVPHDADNNVSTIHQTCLRQLTTGKSQQNNNGPGIRRIDKVDLATYSRPTPAQATISVLPV